MQSLYVAVAAALAETIRAASIVASATLVRMASLSVEHDVCSAVRWVNGPSFFNKQSVTAAPDEEAVAATQQLASDVQEPAHGRTRHRRPLENQWRQSLEGLADGQNVQACRR